MLEQSFGTKQDGIIYRDRIGAYGIGFNEKNEIPVIKTPRGYFLLGGGLEENEAHEECIQRECLEEAGLSVSVGAFICKGYHYYWSEFRNLAIYSTGYFYFISNIQKITEPIELDHELLWLPYEECIDNLFLEHQAWAAKMAYEKFIEA